MKLYEVTIDYTKDYNGESWIATISDEKYIDMDTFERTKAGLEVKLAEAKKEIERFRSMKNREQLVKENESLKDTIAVVLSQKSEWIKSCEQLKQQLIEKQEENNELVFIIEGMEQFIWEQLNNENFDKYKAYVEMFTKIKQLTKHSPYEKTHQDKISFCIEKLEKVKNQIESKVESIYKKLDELNIEIVCEGTSRQLDAYEEIAKKIDNQIKKLKG